MPDFCPCVDWFGPAELQDRAEPDARPAGSWGCVEGVGWAVTEQGGESGVSLAKFFVLCCVVQGPKQSPESAQGRVHGSGTCCA